ncbi:MAG: hypothetical protein ACRCTD_06175 [Beijerinckiaceae bacterium]
MATPTQDDFIRSLTLAVRPGSSGRVALRAPVLSYAKAEPLEQPHHQPVTRAMALFMANLLLLGWIGALHVTKVPTLEERHHAALAALELAEPKEQRLAINAMPPETARELIARMKPADLDDMIETGSIGRLPDIPHPQDTKGYGNIDRALSPGSVLSFSEQKKLLQSVRDTALLAYEFQMGTEIMATGSIAGGSDGKASKAIAQGLGNGNGAAGRRINVNMDKPPLRGSL